METNVVSGLSKRGLQYGIGNIDQERAQPTLRERMGQTYAHDSRSNHTYSFKTGKAGVVSGLLVVNHRRMGGHRLSPFRTVLTHPYFRSWLAGRPQRTGRSQTR